MTIRADIDAAFPGRYEIQPEAERVRWRVVDRLSGECAYSARLPLRGLSRPVAEVWARVMNEGETFHVEVLKTLRHGRGTPTA